MRELRARAGGRAGRCVLSTALVVVHGPGEKRRAFSVPLPAEPSRSAVLSACAVALTVARVEAEPMTIAEDAAGWVVEYTIDDRG